VPTTFFLLVVNIVYVFFDTFGIIDAGDRRRPGRATRPWSTRFMRDGRLGGISAVRRHSRWC